MKNGLYSVHMHMTDGVRGRDSGILILRDGLLIGGGPYFWSIGAYTVGDGTWKGHLSTSQHTPLPDPFVRPLAGGQEVHSGFSGTFGGGRRGCIRHRAGGNTQPEFSGYSEVVGGGLTFRGRGECGVRANVVWICAQQDHAFAWQIRLSPLWIFAADNR
ncbi:hypothetical protein MTX20_29550 [Bradyrhizobium sp. ISRA435]|nr:hypothetical protein MTX20_29550 [Bradyrhizobium sp. ISRA435]